MAHSIDFNPDTVADDGRDYSLLPDGVYIAQIIESDVQPTKAGNGQMLNLTLEILEGPCAHRKLWDRLNIINANIQAQDIAQRTLKKICQAIGHLGVLTDSTALHGKALRIRVGHRPEQGAYRAQNIIRAYEPLDGAGAPPPAAAAPVSMPPPVMVAAVAGVKSRPWA